MQPSVIVWGLETVPDLGGFAAANDLLGKSDVEVREAIGDKKKVWKATGSEIARHYRAQLAGGTPPKKTRRGRNRPEIMRVSD